MRLIAVVLLSVLCASCAHDQPAAPQPAQPAALTFGDCAGKTNLAGWNPIGGLLDAAACLGDMSRQPPRVLGPDAVRPAAPPPSAE